MELSELRQMLGSARCFAVEPAEEHNPGEGGWAWSVQIVTRETNSIGGMQKMLDTALPALLAVAEKAEATIVAHDDLNKPRIVTPLHGRIATYDAAMAAQRTALARLKEA